MNEQELEDEGERRRGKERRSEGVTLGVLGRMFEEHSRQDDVRWEQIADRLNGIRSDVHEMRRLLSGDGSDAAPGIFVRLDRLEQFAKMRGRWVGWLASGGLGATGVWIAERFIK